jgi:hypothetical protein
MTKCAQPPPLDVSSGSGGLSCVIMTGVVIGIAKVQRQGIRSGSVVAPKRLSSGRSWRLCKSCTMIITEPNDYLQRWAVSKRVNSSKADKDDATLIEPVKQAA